MTFALGRMLMIRRWSAMAVALLSIPAYLIAWNLDPWAWGILVLGLWPLQTGLALAGVAARLTGRESRNALASWLIDIALLVMAAGSLAFARTISWT